MSAIALPVRAPLRPVVIALGLALVVTARWAATVSFAADPIVIGGGFGLGLLGVGLAGGRRIALPHLASIPIGLAGGAVLIGVAVLGRFASAGPSAPFAVPFAPWALATILVATAEELVLRGALFDAVSAVSERSGTVAAIIVTSVAFALMHVPLYGWQVVPLDLGVGLWLAGLRLLSGGIAAPAIAHAAADLATYWL
jgi:membrane protease YdiL (CAAX protease family)